MPDLAVDAPDLHDLAKRFASVEALAEFLPSDDAFVAANLERWLG